MKKVLSIIFLVAGIIINAIFGFYSVGLISAFLSPDIKKAQSVGVIGGADGPTVVFVTSRGSMNPIVVIAGTIIGIGIIIYSVIAIRKKKNKE